MFDVGLQHTFDRRLAGVSLQAHSSAVEGTVLRGTTPTRRRQKFPKVNVFFSSLDERD
jgi:hypothetical protein